MIFVLLTKVISASFADTSFCNLVTACKPAYPAPNTSTFYDSVPFHSPKLSYFFLNVDKGYKFQNMLKRSIFIIQ